MPIEVEVLDEEVSIIRNYAKLWVKKMPTAPVEAGSSLDSARELLAKVVKDGKSEEMVSILELFAHDLVFAFDGVPGFPGEEKL